MLRNPIYGFCMVFFPILVVIFFTTLMADGQPVDMPVGVVDQDNTATSRAMTRQLDAMQTSKVVARYTNMNEARRAMQRNETYAFLLIPKGTTRKLMNGEQPKISFYYNGVYMLPGSLTFRDLKTVASLGGARVGAGKLSAIGKSTDEVKTFLQPIVVDLHMIGNPWSNYNVYLSTAMVPGVLMLFVFLITPYSIGTELKFKRSRQWMQMAGGNIHIAIAGKMLPHTVIFTLIILGFEYYIFYILGFPHPGGALPIVLLGALSVLACQCFGLFAFGLMPSLRMSMSICSLWAVLSFSLCGATFPVFAMNPFIEGVANMFPLRHYYMIYQICIFNGYPLSDATWHFGVLILFVLLPTLTIRHIKTAMLKYVYIP